MQDRGMAFDWKNYISFAEELNNNRSDEAALRSSISRAYYGAFCKVRNYIGTKYASSISQTKGDGIHQKIIQVLKESEDSQEFSLGNTLHSLRDERNKADYDAHAKITKPITSIAIKTSNNILTTLEGIIESDNEK